MSKTVRRDTVKERYLKAEKQRSLAKEQSDVKLLREWERRNLKNYDPDDDSSDEEAIAERAKRDTRPPKQQVDEEASAAASMGGRK